MSSCFPWFPFRFWKNVLGIAPKIISSLTVRIAWPSHWYKSEQQYGRQTVPVQTRWCIHWKYWVEDVPWTSAGVAMAVQNSGIRICMDVTLAKSNLRLVACRCSKGHDRHSAKWTKFKKKRSFAYLGTRDTKETNSHKHTRNSHL